MRISIQLIKCHTLQTVPCIVITVETQKYFFNLYESFQRVYKEHLVRFTKGSKIFLSQLSADHINGLIGLILTSEEQGLADSAQIYGPPGFVSYIESIRFLIGNRGLAFSMYDFFNDSKKLLGIKSAEYENQLLSRKDYKQLFFRLHDFLTQEQKSNPTVINDAESFIMGGLYYKDEYMEIHPLLLAQESRDQDIKPSLCYILKSKKIAGKVNAEKLKANNIAPKYIGKLLEQGEIEIDGKKYFAKDFRDPESPVVVIVIIDCPTEAHMESLLSQNRLKELFSGEIDENEQEMKAVVHIVPGRILCNPKYKEFVGKFPGSCHHLFTSGDLKETKVEFTTEEVKEDKKEKGKKNKESKAAVIETVPRGQQNNRSFLLTNVLSQYFPDHFPRLDDLLTTSKYSLDDLFPTLIKKSAYEKMVELVVSPKRIEGFSPILYPMDKVARLINFKENEKFTKKYKKLTSKAKESNPADEMVLTLFKNCDPEVVFLGVQAMMPSVYCNTSGIYLRFWQQNSIGFLLDCGEGSYIQILQHYGPEKAREMIKNLRVIYITHIHADHHLGFLQLIRERDRIYEEDQTVGSPLFLVVPLNCGAWVAKYCKAIDNLKFKVVFSQHIRIETSKADPELDMAHATGGILLQERKHGEEEAKIESEPSSVVEENKIEEDAGEHHGSYNDPDSYAYLVEQEQRSRENLELFHEFLSSELGITRLRAVDVDHCPLAQGIYIEHKDGWKFVYTGDTAPCDVTVEEVGNTTILVHESTFGEDLKDMAKERKHATDKEAMEIGMKMKAWRTVLTHFSQRYLSGLNRQSTKEQLGEMRGYEKENVVRAWDHFSFRFSQMKDLPLLSRCVSNIVESL